MESYWAVKTNGDPISAVQNIVLRFWEQLNIDAMIVPINNNENNLPKARIIQDTDLIKELNPFKPVMADNSARLVPEFLSNLPDKKIGILLRPCEINTLIELSNIGGFSLLNVFTISFDCLGTLPVADYIWKKKHMSVSQNSNQEFLKFSRQGGILSYRNRPACQICSSPEAESADLNINIFGLPVRKVLLIKRNGHDKNFKLDFRKIFFEIAEPDLVEQHIKTTSRIIERNKSTFLRSLKDIEKILPGNVEELITQFRQCAFCSKASEICPVCSLLLQKTENSRDFSRQDMIRWLVTCSGCGMCETICPEHQSLNVIFKYIRSRMVEESIPLNSLKSKKDFLM